MQHRIQEIYERSIYILNSKKQQYPRTQGGRDVFTRNRNISLVVLTQRKPIKVEISFLSF